MGLVLFAAFVAVPLIEIALFIVVGGEIGLWPTIGIVVGTAVVGAVLLQFQGLAVARDAQTRMARGEAPIGSMIHGICLVLAAAFLLTPGFFTDAVGFLLLLPPVRAVIVRFALKRLAARGQTPRDDSVIDGTYEDITPDRSPDRDSGPPRRSIPRPHS